MSVAKVTLSHNGRVVDCIGPRMMMCDWPGCRNTWRLHENETVAAFMEERATEPWMEYDEDEKPTGEGVLEPWEGRGPVDADGVNAYHLCHEHTRKTTEELEAALGAQGAKDLDAKILQCVRDIDLVTV